MSIWKRGMETANLLWKQQNYVKSFFLRTARLWNFLPIECFSLTHYLNGFKSRISKIYLTVGSF